LHSFILKSNKFQALLVDHQTEGHTPQLSADHRLRTAGLSETNWLVWCGHLCRYFL